MPDPSQIGWDWDLVYNKILWSPRCRRVMGLEEFDGTIAAFEALVHPDDLAMVRERRQRAIDECSLYYAEYRILPPGHPTRWISSFGSVERDADDKPRRIIGTVVDTTAYRMTEARIRESEENYRALV